MRAIIALKLADDLPAVKGDFIGADKGALNLALKGIRMKLAVGDFDSIAHGDMDLIKKWADEVITLNPIKDDSDAEAAVLEAFRRGYEDIWLAGAFGGRMDHSYVNIRLALKYPMQVRLYDSHNLIYAVTEGKYTLTDAEYPYVSFFTDTDAVISLDGFKYPLTERELSNTDMYTLSNEILQNKGTLTVHSGKVLVMQCKD